MSSPPLELTGRAGVLPEDVERLVQLGILAPRAGQRPFTPGDVRRVRLASACAEAGLPLEGIGAAMAAGKLIPAVLDHPLFRWSGRTAEPYRDLAARVGMLIALLQRAYEAVGFAPPEPDELVPWTRSCCGGCTSCLRSRWRPAGTTCSR